VQPIVSPPSNISWGIIPFPNVDGGNGLGTGLCMHRIERHFV